MRKSSAYGDSQFYMRGDDMGRNSSNLGYQITSAISACTAEGQSKRAYKNAHNGQTDYKIFGLTYKNDLCQTGKEMARFIHERYPDVKMVREIRPHMVQEYLDSKTETAGSRATVEKIFSHVRKIDAVLCHKYRTAPYGQGIRMPDMEQTEKVRSQVMSEEKYQDLKNSLSGSASGAVRSVILSHACGLRLEETAGVKMERFRETGGRWGYGTFAVLKGDGSKGNRERVIDIPDAGRLAEIKELVQGLQPGQFIVSKKDGSAYDKKSLTRTISRHMDRLGFSDDWKGNKNHALRKEFAQTCYDVCRRSGMSKQESLAYVNVQLGHSGNRSDLSETYVAMQW